MAPWMQPNWYPPGSGAACCGEDCRSRGAPMLQPRHHVPRDSYREREARRASMQQQQERRSPKTWAATHRLGCFLHKRRPRCVNSPSVIRRIHSTASTAVTAFFFKIESSPTARGHEDQRTNHHASHHARHAASLFGSSICGHATGGTLERRRVHTPAWCAPWNDVSEVGGRMPWGPGCINIGMY